ncbi:amino acid/amide ABC transporter substrate-binding protein, HAAT family (TC 3.A.1.4.-) [Amphritea atlantica]|uniref:Amino acid/amide ABC transporter substrate-binding protein, HAAT family (TC 3.A.1.4.-) n=1 Tax=Amphritea atlantica TaxID=355243 RepID=A0A1H9DJL3_9GAMM|nr:ABC transporter substrate-binding protein [Amphritea atlantica]SEQ13654.1 amino acid/amide ABC transporter substrate-binding protein, HAAT family (TC 3.A.1.4.-) [Amphritea atlantica]
MKKIMLRNVLISAVLSATSSLTLAADGITIYGVKSVSGAFASYGKYADMGSKLAVEDYGDLLGQSVHYETIDTEGNAGKAVRKVQEAISQDNARFFDGATLSSTALAIGKEVNKVNGVFITPAGADELTGSDCNMSTFRWSVPTYGAIRQTVKPLIDKFPEKKRWYTITPQYVFGEALLNNAKAVFAEEGIEHVGNSYHSLKEQEFSGYLTNAMAAQPDVLLLLNFGSQSSNALRQAVNFGLKNQMTILVAWSSGLDQLQELGPDIAEGVYFGAQYWHTVDTPMNKALVKRVKEVYGMNPNYPLAADYISTTVILDAIAKAGTTDSAAVAKALEGATYEGPTGSEVIRKADHQVLKDYYLLEGKPAADMADQDDYVNIISSGKSFPDESALTCKRS